MPSDPYATTPGTAETPPTPADSTTVDLPAYIGRYRIERVLGEGGFGRVYLAYDGQLSRRVAIKVPHAQRISSPDDAHAYLAEARTVAGLDHPHMVAVHDCGATDKFPVYVVSKYVEGTDLAGRLRHGPMPLAQAAELVAVVADALHHAHKQGLVHRDVKPANILIDAAGTPYLVDFGLALREEHVGQGPHFAGTPAYMSPEQARGEGHRVDGRSDVFSLGVVLYELLAGRRPFAGPSTQEYLDQVCSLEPRPPRQFDETIPKDVERICLKALAKRATDRYSTAHDLADELRQFLAEMSPGEREVRSSKTTQADPTSAETSALRNVPVTPSDSLPVKIVPKGLRSFDAHDADFFLELLPGPRDRQGLPDNLRFWKTCIEETDAEATFSVGLIYGPSGCGKSSLVKAGLLPRLSNRVLSVYIEATADDTATRLLNGLRKRCPALPENLNLKDSLAALRCGQGLSPGKKVLLVLDQFEQWLHANRDEQNTELVQALRQCDGARVQCIVMVRDDFWLAVSRFLRELEVRLVEGHNSTLVDLFDVDHARKVLSAFGRAYGRQGSLLAPREDVISRNEISKMADSPANSEYCGFLNQAVAGLAEDGKVVSVRLALFAEMMKSKPWTPASLKEAGGAQGVGVAFLEETFSTRSAPPEHRYHQQAARAVLKSLLPESGAQIKGNLRSHDELLAASCYAQRPQDFEELLRILDGALRLITPTDPEGADDAHPGALQEGEIRKSPKLYQLTHDYLVPSLRDWLTRKQRETRRGRAELRLAGLSAAWNERPQTRRLPALWEFVNIWLLTRSKDWTGPQRVMMRQARRFHTVRTGLFVAAVAAFALGGIEITGHSRATALVEQLASADITQVPGIVERLDGYRRWADPLLAAHIDAAREDAGERIHLSLARLPVDDVQADYLRQRLLDVSPRQFPIVRDALLPHRVSLVEPLWTTAADESLSLQERFQAACALATYSPSDDRWKEINTLVAQHLVTLAAADLVVWREALKDAKQHLIGPLGAIYRDTAQREQSRIYATETLAAFAVEQPDLLLDLLADAVQFQFPTIYAPLSLHRDQVVPPAERLLAESFAADASDEQKEHLARRQANVAVALLKLQRPKAVWPLFRFAPDQRTRSYLIHWLGPLGVEAGAIVDRFEAEADVTARRAILLAVGEFTPAQLPESARPPLVEKLLSIYEHEPDSGLRAAAEWLLRRWGQTERITAVVEKLKQDEQQLPDNNRKWYVNGQGQTMVILEAGEFLMGSPTTEPRHLDNEKLHRRKIARRFAIAAHEVTKEQFTRSQGVRPEIIKEKWSQWVKTVDSPQTGMAWFEAAAYCNWLSKQEGIAEDQLCYEPNADQKYATGMKAKSNYLDLTGYRLPSEAEWEYACRAGTVTSRYYGVNEDLLSKYVWFQPNGDDRTWPVGSLKPNDAGLFDMLGNAYERCHDQYLEYDVSGKEVVNAKVVNDLTTCVARGGGFNHRALDVRAAHRSPNAASFRTNSLGFRPARTYP